MIVKEITPEEAKAILCRPDIYDTISDDDSPPASEFTPPDDCQYIGGFAVGELIAVMIYHKFRDGEKLHIQILPEHRMNHAMEFGRLGLDIGKAKGRPIYADIPDAYPNVLRYAQSFGFDIIERINSGMKKNGIIVPTNILKLTDLSVGG